MKLKKSYYDIAVEIICPLLLIGTALFLLISWKRLPSQIPAHYNAAGEIDRMGDKSELLIMPIFSWILYLGITAVQSFPQVWNTGVTVTPENAEKVYRILKNIIKTTKFIVVADFSFITVWSALGRALPVWLTPAVLIAVFGSLIYYLIQLRRAK